MAFETKQNQAGFLGSQEFVQTLTGLKNIKITIENYMIID